MSLAILGIVLMLGASFLARRRALEAERRDRDRASRALASEWLYLRTEFRRDLFPKDKRPFAGPGVFVDALDAREPDPGRASDGHRGPLPRDARHRVRPGREEEARRGGVRLSRGLPGGAAPVTRRGFSLVEMCVVVMIGVVLLFALLPVAMGLLRQQAGLNARSLGIDTWPLLLERLGADAGRSAGALVSPPFASAAFRLRFPPEKEEDPDVTWTFGDGRAERTTERRKPDGEVVRATTTWDLPGTLLLEPDELENGRLLLAWDDGSGPELVALACGRPTENAR